MKGKGRRVEGREEMGGARREGTDNMYRRGKDFLIGGGIQSLKLHNVIDNL